MKKTTTQKYYPTTDSDVPGKAELLYWDSRLQTWYPRQRYTMNNSGTKWPEGYKGFISAVKSICRIKPIGTNINEKIEIEQIRPITIEEQEQQIKSKGQMIFDEIIVKMKYVITPLKNKDLTTLFSNLKKGKIDETQKFLLDKDLVNLPSTKVAYGLLIAVNDLLLEYDKNSILTQNNNELLLKKSSEKSSLGIIENVVTLETNISMKYLMYMEKYGIPDNGIFDEEKLNEFILDDYSAIFN